MLCVRIYMLCLQLYVMSAYIYAPSILLPVIVNASPLLQRRAKFPHGVMQMKMEQIEKITSSKTRKVLPMALNPKPSSEFAE